MFIKIKFNHSSPHIYYLPTYSRLHMYVCKKLTTINENYMFNSDILKISTYLYSICSDYRVIFLFFMVFYHWKGCFQPLLSLSRRVGGPHFALLQWHCDLLPEFSIMCTWNQEAVGRDQSHIDDVKSSFILPDQGPSIDPTFLFT